MKIIEKEQEEIKFDSYQAVLPYKDKIRDFKILHQEKEIVLRYPLFSLEERMNLDLQYRALILHFYCILNQYKNKHHCYQ